MLGCGHRARLCADGARAHSRAGGRARGTHCALKPFSLLPKTQGSSQKGDLWPEGVGGGEGGGGLVGEAGCRPWALLSLLHNTLG